MSVLEVAKRKLRIGETVIKASDCFHDFPSDDEELLLVDSHVRQSFSVTAGSCS